MDAMVSIAIVILSIVVVTGCSLFLLFNVIVIDGHDLSQSRD